MNEAMVQAIVKAVMSRMNVRPQEEDRNGTDSAAEGRGLFSFGNHRMRHPDMQSSDAIIGIAKKDDDHPGHTRACIRSILRFLEEIGIFMMNSHVWVKHEYRRRVDLEQTLLKDNCGLLNETSDIHVFAGESLYHKANDQNFAAFLPSIKRGLQSMTQSVGDPFFIKSVRVAILNDAAHHLDPKVCVVLIGDEPRLIRARRLNIFLIFDQDRSTEDTVGDGFCDIYNGSIDTVEADEFTKRLSLRINGRNGELN